ncbi:response regulator [Cyanobacteria bacterium FACHB-DQ100]|nr:response regulator [Cyanobacteria bacterium FACHB-DQ100]
MTQPRILLIDDNPGDRALAIRALKQTFSNLQVQEVLDQGGLNRAIREKNFDLVVTDFQIRWTTGIDVLLAIKEQDPTLPVIMFTNTGTEEIAVEAMKLGLDDYILKRSDAYARLPAAVSRSLENVRIRAELERYTNIRVHDLNEALQTILSLSSRLLERSTSRSQADQTDFQQIYRAAQTASELLQDLLPENPSHKSSNS